MNPEDTAGKTILFLVPHADDLHYQAGGTAALWPLEAMDPDSPLIPKLQREHYREIMGTFVRERARATGERCGCQYAEGFRTIHLGFPYDLKGFHEWLAKWIPES